MFKLIALDIDYTLTNAEGLLSDLALAQINKAQENGIHIALISARPPNGIYTVSDRLQKKVYKAAYLGAYIQDEENKELRSWLLDSDIAQDIASFADENQISLTVTINHEEYHTQNDFSRPSMIPKKVVLSAKEALNIDGSCPILMGTEGHESSELLYNYCENKYRGVISFVRHFNGDGSLSSVMLVHPNANKGEALTIICDQLRISSRHVLAIGDSESDVYMFQKAGVSAAVGNASNEVKEKATVFAPMPYGEGVAWALANINQLRLLIPN